MTSGPVAAENELLSDLTARLDRRGERWPATLMLVVPSRSLRDHLESRIVDHEGRAVLGVRCTTLFGLALELTEDVTGRQLGGSDLFPLFARRLARGERALQQALEPLADGYSSLLGSVRDLLDAGLEPTHAEPLVEALEEDGLAVASAREVARAQALVRVAAGTVDALAQIGAGRRSTLLADAAAEVRLGSHRMVAPQEVWIYGFADASGVALDLIEALLSRIGGRLYLDQPPDPVDSSRPDAGVAFTRRFRERVETVALPGSDPAADAGVPAREFRAFRALGSDGEIREVGHRIRQLLDGGTRPERVTVVARQVGPYARALRLQFGSLGIPFSAPGTAAGKSRLGRRAEALADLLEGGARTTIERWLEVVAKPFESRPHFDLRTAFATLGLGRLGEAAGLASDRYRLEHDLPLSTRHGFRSPRTDDDGRGLYLRRRRVPAAALAAAVGAATSLVEHFAGWQQEANLEAHQGAFEHLLAGHCQWEIDGPDYAVIQTAARAVWESMPAGAELSFEEFIEGAAGRLREIGSVPLGGDGGGVLVLDAVQARGLTSEHLFLVGLNRSVFPRVVREDPLLPDPLRNVLSRQGFGVLPDLPDKRMGFDEERFLFAQLLASSPSVTLSWQDTDDEQLPLAPSPLLERLRWTGSDDSTWRSPPLARPVIARTDAVPRSPDESAIAIALHAERSRLAAVLPLLLADQAGDPSALATARIAVLDEQDPREPWVAERAREALGPYLGFVGQASDGDPRREQKLYVTALERLAGCPWQVFLGRVLRLQPVPDPLAALPGITPLLIGALVHAVVEEVVRRGFVDQPRSLEQARHRIPLAVAWPSADELTELVGRQAVILCREQGIAVPGFAAALSRAVAPYLETTRELDWPAGGVQHVLGVELEGVLELPDLAGHSRAIYFRADRLDLASEGLVLTDYKTGRRVVSQAKQARSRRGHLLASVANGERLQAMAYALAAGAEADTGRYLFVHPELGDDRGIREVSVRRDDSEMAAAFSRAAGAALATWDTGTFFPRLVEPDRDEEPTRCQYCDVRDACVRGDSGARRRLRDQIDSLQGSFIDGRDLTSDQLVTLTQWRLPSAESS